MPANTAYVAGSTTLNGALVADVGGVSALVNGILIHPPSDPTPGSMPRDPAGNPVGGEFAVNTYTVDDQYWPAMAANRRGAFVVTWSSYGQDGSAFGVFGQKYDQGSVRVGAEFQANTYTTGYQYLPRVGMESNGSFVVVWNSFYPGQDGSDGAVIGRRFDSAGLAAEVVPGAAAPPGAAQKPLVRSVTLKVTAGPEVALGVREYRVATALGVSSIGQLVVVDDPVVQEKGDNNTRAKANPVRGGLPGLLDEPEVR